MGYYSIRDLEQLSGIKAHTLRIWEQRYHIVTPKRTDTNIRTYDDQDLKRILNISLLNNHGFKISEIARLSDEEMYQEVVQLSDQQLNYPDQIYAMTLAMLDLDEDRFEQIMRANSQQFGFENSMIHIIYPFLGRIGTLWMTGSIGPAQEHFMSNLIRQKIIAAIENQSDRQRPDGKKYMLFLPEGELHEIGLLLANYMIRARGHKVVYLGHSLPFSELVFAYKRHQPDYLFTAITSAMKHHEVQPYVDQLTSTFPDAYLLVTGYQVVGQDIAVSENGGAIINRIDDLIRFASA